VKPIYLDHNATTARLRHDGHIDIEADPGARYHRASRRIGATAWRGVRDDIDGLGRERLLSRTDSGRQPQYTAGESR